MTISCVNKHQLPFLALVLNTITPPQPHHNCHVFTHAAADKTREGAQKGLETEKGWVYQVRLLYFFTYFYFLWFPLPAQPSLSWGMPHSPNYAMPSCQTQKMRHLWHVLHFQRPFFGGHLAPSPSHQHPLPVSPPPSHLPNMKNAPFVAHFLCLAAILWWVTCPPPPVA